MFPFRVRSIQSKIALWSGVSLVGTAVILIAYSVWTLRQSAIEATQTESIAVAQAQAAIIKRELDTALDTARTMAGMLSLVKDPSNPIKLTRDQANGFLRKVLDKNPSYLGTYTLWEPNEFDGLDSEYINAPAHDETGRFIPYWVRGADGRITQVALVDYETPGIGDWYLIPRERMIEVIIAPFFYPIEGQDVLLTSLVVPIIEGGRFYGIAGVDLPIGFLQNLMDQISIYGGQARAALVTDRGKFAGVNGQPELTNQSATLIFKDYDKLQPRIVQGESFYSLSEDGQYLEVFAPVRIGRTGTAWTVGLSIPFNIITAKATAAAVRQVMIGVGLVLLAVFLLWYLAGRIAQPIRVVTEAAQAVANGDFSVVSRVHTGDETQVLSEAFNKMTAQLGDLVGKLEQRVAERTRALETSTEVSRRLSTILDQNQLVISVVDEIQQAFDYYHVHIYLFDEVGEYLVMVGGTGSAGQRMLQQGHKILRGRGLVGRAAETNRSVLVPDTTQDPGWLPNPLLPETRSEAAVPISSGDAVLGVLDVQQNIVDGLGEADVRLLESIANQVAVAVQNARLFSKSQQQAETETLVNMIGQKIQQSTTIDDVLQVAIKELSSAIGSKHGFIQLGVRENANDGFHNP